MKYQTLTILFFLFAGIVTTTFAQQNDSTTIKITFPNTEKWQEVDTAQLEYYHPIFSEIKTSVYFEKSDVQKNELIAKISISKPTSYFFIFEKNLYIQILIFPNDQVDISFREKKKPIFSKSKLSKEYQSTWNNREKYSYSDFVKYEWQEYVEKVDSLIKQEISDYELAFKDEKPNPIFDTYFRNKVVSSHNYAFGYYPFFHNRYYKKQEMVATMPQAYFDVEPKVPYIIPSNLQEDYPYTSDYIIGVSGTLAKEGNCEPKQGKIYEFETYHCIYKNTYKIATPQLKKWAILHILEGMIRKVEWSNLSQTEIIDKIFISLEKEFPNDENINHLKSKAKNSKRFAKGQPATDFTLKDENGKVVSLSDFKGKYILIDFWSTWCKPCIEEIPFSKELEEEFSDNVTFLYVCMASKEDKWKEMIEEKGLKGLQLFVEGEAQKQMADDYQVSFYPTYILLDREGKIITKNIRPSNNGKEVLKETIEAEK